MLTRREVCKSLAVLPFIGMGRAKVSDSFYTGRYTNVTVRHYHFKTLGLKKFQEVDEYVNSHGEIEPGFKMPGYVELVDTMPPIADIRYWVGKYCSYKTRPDDTPVFVGLLYHNGKLGGYEIYGDRMGLSVEHKDDVISIIENGVECKDKEPFQTIAGVS